MVAVETDRITTDWETELIKPSDKAWSKRRRNGMTFRFPAKLNLILQPREVQ